MINGPQFSLNANIHSVLLSSSLFPVVNSSMLPDELDTLLQTTNSNLMNLLRPVLSTLLVSRLAATSLLPLVDLPSGGNAQAETPMEVTLEHSLTSTMTRLSAPAHLLC
jgi:hypothetical protein